MSMMPLCILGYDETLDGPLCVFDAGGQFSSLEAQEVEKCYPSGGLNHADLGLLKVVDLVQLLLEHRREFALIHICPTTRGGARL